MSSVLALLLSGSCALVGVFMDGPRRWIWLGMALCWAVMSGMLWQ